MGKHKNDVAAVDEARAKALEDKVDDLIKKAGGADDEPIHATSAEVKLIQRRFNRLAVNRLLLKIERLERLVELSRKKMESAATAEEFNSLIDMASNGWRGDNARANGLGFHNARSLGREVRNLVSD